MNGTSFYRLFKVFPLIKSQNIFSFQFFIETLPVQFCGLNGILNQYFFLKFLVFIFFRFKCIECVLIDPINYFHSITYGKYFYFDFLPIFLQRIFLNEIVIYRLWCKMFRIYYYIFFSVYQTTINAQFMSQKYQKKKFITQSINESFICFEKKIT